MMEKVVDC